MKKKKKTFNVKILSYASVSLGDIEDMKVTYLQTIKPYTLHPKCVANVCVCFIMVLQTPASSSNTWKPD